ELKHRLNRDLGRDIAPILNPRQRSIRQADGHDPAVIGGRQGRTGSDECRCTGQDGCTKEFSHQSSFHLLGENLFIRSS
ncbi:MAG TPA: hypothetical protein VJ859_05300, partial [Allosphingosinicella sp.]|nr:hypothetical protein [Allosphingosinicella sp.]